MDLTTVLAALLGVGLGLVAIVAPEALVRVHTAGRLPTGRHGEYGADGVPERWTQIVRLVGVALIGAGLYFAWQLL